MNVPKKDGYYLLTAILYINSTTSYVDSINYNGSSYTIIFNAVISTTAGVRLYWLAEN